MKKKHTSKFPKFISIHRPLVALLITFTLTLSCFGYVNGPKLYQKYENYKFEQFLDEYFKENVTSNTLNLHYIISNPAKFDISIEKVTLGHFPQNSNLVMAEIDNSINSLKSFNYNLLYTKNKLDYDILLSDFKSEKRLANYYLMEEPLSFSNGIHSQLPILLQEYKFRSADDIANYLNILKEVKGYFLELSDFEAIKANAGYFMEDKSCLKVIKACKNFIKDPNKNFLITTFPKRISKVKGITKNTQKKLIRQNKALIKNSVIPAYKQLIVSLSKLLGRGNNNKGLCYYTNGENYYNQLVPYLTNCNTSSKDLFIKIAAYRTYNLQECNKCLFKENSKQINSECNKFKSLLNHKLKKLPKENFSNHNFNSDKYGVFSEDTKQINFLKNSMLHNFPPAPDNTKFTLESVNKELKESLAPAFYITAPIDDHNCNTIYINRAKNYDSINYFTTLAHEGFPGHLYQTVMSYKYGIKPFRSLLDFGGYVEGWATYVEMMSYYYTGLSSNTAKYLQNNQAATLSLYASCDIGIHYFGWTYNELKTFWSEYGIKDSKTIKEIQELIIATPGNYLKYYVGYINFLELKDKMMKKYGNNFDEVRFHKAILKMGPAPFEILEKYFDEFYSYKK